MRLLQHLYLTGYRGTGKTSVGAILAKRLGRPLIDLDLAIEAAAGKSIREIFSGGGEAAFRDLESNALRTAVQSPAAVISLGGGAILRGENRRLIAGTGLCVWLDADAETIARRLAGDEATAGRRPALTSLGQLEEIRELLHRRREHYQAAAAFRVDTTGKTIAQVAEEIMSLLEQRPGESEASGASA
jgi:shikimate kinase